MFAVKLNSMFLSTVTDLGYYDYDNESEAYDLSWDRDESSALAYSTRENAQHMANWAFKGAAISGDEEVMLEITSAFSGIVIRPVEHSDYYYIVMPVKLQ